MERSVVELTVVERLLVGGALVELQVVELPVVEHDRLMLPGDGCGTARSERSEHVDQHCR